MSDPRIITRLYLANKAGHPNRWAFLVKVTGASLNIEAYGDSPSAALDEAAGALTTDDWSTLRWAAEHDSEPTP